jgi:RNA recognition motif-containing protein
VAGQAAEESGLRDGNESNDTAKRRAKMNIYAGNLSQEVTEDDLKTAFAVYGKVETVNIIKDKDTGRSKGFGFVEMPDDTEARSAITGLNDKEFRPESMPHFYPFYQ